jgi:hypothetical protein
MIEKKEKIEKQTKNTFWQLTHLWYTVRDFNWLYALLLKFQLNKN